MSACRLGKFGARKMLYNPYRGLTFAAEKPNVVVNMAKSGSPPSVTLEKSTDGKKRTTLKGRTAT